MLTASQRKVARWTAILSSLDEHGFLSTSQIQRLHNTGGRRNTLRILTDMADYLHSFRIEETVWYLSAAGRKEIGSTRVRKRTLAVHHTLMRTEVYIAVRPTLWRVEQPIKWQAGEIVPDALYRAGNGGLVFLEVDLTQSMAENERKIERYRALKETGLFQRQFGEFPMIHFVTTTEYRRKRLRALLDGMKAEVLVHNEIV